MSTALRNGVIGIDASTRLAINNLPKKCSTVPNIKDSKQGHLRAEAVRVREMLGI
jgi:hypothetical protein